MVFIRWDQRHHLHGLLRKTKTWIFFQFKHGKLLARFRKIQQCNRSRRQWSTTNHFPFQDRSIEHLSGIESFGLDLSGWSKWGLGQWKINFYHRQLGMGLVDGYQKWSFICLDGGTKKRKFTTSLSRRVGTCSGSFWSFWVEGKAFPQWYIFRIQKSFIWWPQWRANNWRWRTGKEFWWPDRWCKNFQSSAEWFGSFFSLGKWTGRSFSFRFIFNLKSELWKSINRRLGIQQVGTWLQCQHWSQCYWGNNFILEWSCWKWKSEIQAYPSAQPPIQRNNYNTFASQHSHCGRS